jgi:tetratricopeptide (TPR) repeat protein
VASVPTKNLLTPANLQQIEELVKSRELDVAQGLLLPALAQARATNNKAMQVKLLYLQGRIYGERADFGRAIVTLQETIELAKSLTDIKLLLQPTFTLSTIYYVTDQNAAAATQAANCLALAQQCHDLFYQSASLQMLAISQFVANRSPQSEEMLRQSLQLALACKNSDYVLQGYTYLGFVKTERKQYLEAAKWFDKALEFTRQEAEPQKRVYLAFTVEGYYARLQALAGNLPSAIRLYQRAIEHANKAKVVQHLALSQLYRGLGTCYAQQKQQLNAERAFAKSEVLEEEAYKRCETNNTAMSFALERQAARRCN